MFVAARVFEHPRHIADLHFGEIRPFLIFNVADAAITIGVLTLLVRALLMRDTSGDAANGTETVDA